MQTFLCNVCERPLQGSAFEFSSITGQPVAGEQGATRITHRSNLRLLHLCDRCGNWLRVGIKSVGDSLSAATALRNDRRWLDPAAFDPTPPDPNR